jgi:hypothetical protein
LSANVIAVLRDTRAQIRWVSFPDLSGRRRGAKTTGVRHPVAGATSSSYRI